MEYVIEINSFYKKFLDFINTDGEWRVEYPVTISRYFECLEVKFLITDKKTGKSGAMYKEATADVLPRIESSSLKFQTNVNVEDGIESKEKWLSQRIAAFFTRVCSDDATAVNAFVQKLAPERIKIFFLLEPDTLLLRISD